MNRILWYLWQLLPLTYQTTFRDMTPGSPLYGKKVLTIWRMWLGRCFDVREYQLGCNCRENDTCDICTNPGEAVTA